MAKTLISDDFKKWHDVAERNLSYFGFREFLHAYDIKEGLALYEASKPGLVLTDINFDTSNPKNLDGLILCRQIRDKNKDTIVVVMTTIEGLKELAIAHGAHYFIQKQHFKEEIEAFVRSHYGITGTKH